VVRSRRENMRPKMTLTADWIVNATSEEVRRYEDERDRKRREGEERFLCFPGEREGNENVADAAAATGEDLCLRSAKTRQGDGR